MYESSECSSKTSNFFFKKNAPVQIRDRASTQGSYFSIIDRDFIFLIEYFTLHHEAEGNMADRFRICCTYLINRFSVHRICHLVYITCVI